MDGTGSHANPELIAIGVIARDSARAATWRGRTLTEVWHWAYANGEKSWDSIGCCSDAEVGLGIASRAASSLNVVMRGSDGQLWHQHWDGHWSGWSPLGGRLTSRPAIAATTAGRLDVVAIGTDKTLKHRSWGD